MCKAILIGFYLENHAYWRTTHLESSTVAKLQGTLIWEDLSSLQNKARKKHRAERTVYSSRKRNLTTITIRGLHVKIQTLVIDSSDCHAYSAVCLIGVHKSPLSTVNDLASVLAKSV